jgi:hypothetical protein
VRTRDEIRSLCDLCTESESGKPIVEVNPADLVESRAPRQKVSDRLASTGDEQRSCGKGKTHDQKVASES